MDHIVVDVEIAKTIEETPGGWDATDKLGIGVACIWEYTGQRMRVYGPEELQALRERLLKADRISGFNIWRFDFPVIWGYSRQEWDGAGVPFESEAKTPSAGVASLRYVLCTKTDDMLRRIWQALKLNPDQFTDAHKGWGLDAVAGQTLGASKIGFGGDAPVWYQLGQIQRVANYCADDVALERDLTDFVERFGYVLRDTRRLKIPAWTPGNA